MSMTLSINQGMSPATKTSGPVIPAAVRETLQGPPRPVDVLHALRRRWLWIAVLGAVLPGIAMFVADRKIPVEYTAAAWLRVSLQRPKVVFETRDDDPLLRQRQTQATLITSNLVLNAALRREGIAQLPLIAGKADPVQWLRQQIRVRFPGEADILEISMKGEDPQQIKEIVNAVKDAYMEQVVNVDREFVLRRKNLLQQSYERTLELVKNRSARYEELANAVGSSDSEVVRRKAITALETLADHRRRVNEIRRQIGGLDRKVAVLRSRLELLEKERPESTEEERRARDEAVIKRIVEAGLSADPWLTAATQRKSLIESQLFEERQRVAPGAEASTVRRLAEELRTLEAAVAQRRAELEPALTEYAREQLVKGRTGLPPTEAERLQGEIAAAELEKAVLEDELKMALEQFEKEAADAERFGKYSADLEAERAELERLKAIADRTGDELERWNVELEAPPRVVEFEPADVPRVNNLQDKQRLVLFIGLTTLAGVLIVVVLGDYLLRPVSSTSQLAYGLGLPVIGDMPLLRRRWLPNFSRNGAIPADIRAVLTESVDQIRTTLLHRAKQDGLKVVLVTSALAQEGKTTAAAQLALSLARAGRRTVLVDGDIRRPRVHRIFGRRLGPGLSEWVRGEVKLPEVVQQTEFEMLQVVTAGHGDAAALEGFAQGRADDLFQRLREAFDFIVVDTSPLLTAADALVLTRLADGALLSVLQDGSRLARVYEAAQKLRAVDMPLLGVIVHGAHFRRYRSYYRRYTIDVAPQPSGKT